MPDQNGSSSYVELANLLGRNASDTTFTEDNIFAGNKEAQPLGSDGYSRRDALLFILSFVSGMVVVSLRLTNIFIQNSIVADNEVTKESNSADSLIDAPWTNMRWKPISTRHNCLPGFQLANTTLHCGVGKLSPLTTDSDGTKYCGGVKLEPNHCLLPIEGRWTTPEGDSKPPLSRRLGISGDSNILPRCKTMEKLMNGSFEGDGFDQEWVPGSCSAVPLSPFAWTENAKCKTTITMIGDSHVRNLFTATVSGLRGLESFAEVHFQAGKSGGEVRSYEWRLKNGIATDRVGIYLDAKKNEPIPFEDCPCGEVQRCLRIAFIWAPTFKNQLRWMHLAQKWESDLIIATPGNDYERSLVLSSNWTAQFDKMLQQNNNLQLGILHFVRGKRPGEGRARKAALNEWITNGAHSNRMSYLIQSEIRKVGRQIRSFHFACSLRKVNAENDMIAAAEPCTDMTDTAQIRALVTVHFDAFSNENSQHFDANSTQYFDVNPTIPTKHNITVHLTGGRPNSAYSIFQTDILPRYGSGRVQFLIREHAQCDRSCNATTQQQPHSYRENNHYAPCLAVGPEGCRSTDLNCNYPRCKTMVTNDERCTFHSYDVRQYYSANIPNTGYLPLGPRLDAWTSFQKIQSSPDFFVKQASKRKYAFNAIFSQSTNKRRRQLAGIIEEQQNNTALPIFTTMAKKWHRYVNNPQNEQLDTDSYMKAVLDSIFTLSPAGHNPECYRMFEAVEAGSIPIFVKNDLYIKKKKCMDALHHWYDAPILVLESWNDLYTTVERLMGDLEALDEMQVKLRTWYDEYMRKVIREFEDFMIDSYRLEENVDESKLTDN
ncbi:hypothetical protein ACHAXR_004566, partial [Thalassiosira sp. AJA248-18]